MPTDKLALKVCQKCQRPLDVGEFYHTWDKRYQREVVRNICRRCWSEKNSTHYEQQKAERKLSEFRAKYIVKDATCTDRRRGGSNDLTVEWVEQAIASGCQYCGETGLQMTLDRIDNSKAHTCDNVVPACVRCNFIRKTMPYDAWLLLVPNIRQAREQGLFGEWTGAIVRHGQTRIALGIKQAKPRDPGFK